MNKLSKDKINCALESLNHEELTAVMGRVRLTMLVRAGVTSSTHCVCPITNKVITRKAAKKIVTILKESKTHIETSWYYMSRKAYNKIISQ